MRVKSIRGTIKYDGIVYQENQEFEIREEDFKPLQENIEVMENTKISTKTENKDVFVTEEEEKDYTKMKKAELIKEAEEKGIEIPDKATNAEIIELLKENE